MRVARAQRVLGIDPGLANTGYGLVVVESGRMSAHGHGSITTPRGADVSDRLDILYKETRRVIAEMEPHAVAIEQLFFNTNQKTAMAVAQARGVIMLACNHEGVEASEYTPLQVKMSLVGYGNATKDQVKYMVCSILKMKDAPETLHATDALAMAICHLQSSRLNEKIARAGG